MRTSAGSAPTVAARIQAYLAAVPPGSRRALRAIRTVVRAQVPDATEVFSYGIPGFRLDDKPLVWYAGWQDHLSLYPITAAVRRDLGPALTGYAASRGTVKIPLDARLPVTLIKRMVKARKAEIRAKKTPKRGQKRVAARKRKGTA